jgi:hypothetical protein
VRAIGSKKQQTTKINKNKMRKMKRKKECQPNPFTCESHIFTNSTFKLDVMPLDTLIGS